MTDKSPNDELVERLRGDYNKEDVELAIHRIEMMNKFLRHNAFPEKHFGVFFICGEAGEKDTNGIPEEVHICPAYGSNVVYRFARGKSFGGGW